MNDYKIVITLRDQTEVTAHSDMEALDLAEVIFKEAGYNLLDADLDIIEVTDAGDYDDSDELKLENM